MPIHKLLAQVVAEHEALQSRYDEALVEIGLLRTRLANAGMVEGSSTKSVEEDVEAAPLQLQFLCEPVHSTLDSRADGDAEEVHGSHVPKVSGLRFSGWDVGSRFAKSWLSSTPLPFTRRNDLRPTRATLSTRQTVFLQVGNSSSIKTTENGFVKFLRHKIVELFFAAVVISNLVLLWVETDRRAARLPKAVWSDIANVVYLIIYSSEFLVRVLAYRTRVFDDKWNCLDCGVIAIDVLFTVTEALFGSSFSLGLNASIFRLLRLFRLVRIFTVFRYVPELQLLIHGFFGAMKAVFFATIILFVVILLWSFIFVEAIHPQVLELTQIGKFDDCPRCQRSYASLWDAQMTILQQIVAGDSWGMITLEVIFAYPATSILFIACLMSVQFAVLNLIFTVIVDAAMRHREEDSLLTLQEKERRFREAKKKMVDLSESLDTDNSGDLTMDELIAGYESNQVFVDTMASMDITSEDMGALFISMDDDRSGSVSAVEFVNNMYNMQERDIRTTLMFLQVHMKDMRSKMKDMSSNRNQTLKIEKHVENMMLHIEDLMMHLEVQKKDQDGKAEEDLSAFEAASEAIEQHEDCAGDILGERTPMDASDEQWKNAMAAVKAANKPRRKQKQATIDTAAVVDPFQDGFLSDASEENNMPMPKRVSSQEKGDSALSQLVGKRIDEHEEYADHEAPVTGVSSGGMSQKKPGSSQVRSLAPVDDNDIEF